MVLLVPLLILGIELNYNNTTQEMLSITNDEENITVNKENSTDTNFYENSQNLNNNSTFTENTLNDTDNLLNSSEENSDLANRTILQQDENITIINETSSFSEITVSSSSLNETQTQNIHIENDNQTQTESTKEAVESINEQNHTDLQENETLNEQQTTENITIIDNYTQNTEAENITQINEHSDVNVTQIESIESNQTEHNDTSVMTEQNNTTLNIENQTIINANTTLDEQNETLTDINGNATQNTENETIIDLNVNATSLQAIADAHNYTESETVKSNNETNLVTKSETTTTQSAENETIDIQSNTTVSAAESITTSNASDASSEPINIQTPDNNKEHTITIKSHNTPRENRRIAPNITRKQCPPHMELDTNNKCKCVSDYLYDGNICFKCAPPCHPRATCVSPGKCVCKEGYAGDGIRSCSSTTPKISKISPNSASANGGTIINIVLDDEIPMEVHAAYCRFGATIVSAFSVGGKEAKCRAPTHIPEKVIFAFSYDHVKWSKDEIEFTFIEKNSSFEFPFDRKFVFVIVVCVILGVIYILFLRKKDKNDDLLPLLQNNDEMVPFIQKKREHLD
ncbi:hypothetical protein GPJ56_004650 [Histomonas meleagridis]|uniref:uncharacterized protein n=1 Tax=Histomonas meleagridis TaxID=135588 RepID=UPI00355A73CD|nr:hypothetical protein GPJ56_004650 [Histomonas meleagridis]KAH0797412.1 hypothetical protein GO595_009733 [Histomonas meleagridis]